MVNPYFISQNIPGRIVSNETRFLEMFDTRYFYKQCIDNHVPSLSACEKLAGIFLVGDHIIDREQDQVQKQKTKKEKKMKNWMHRFSFRKCQKSERVVIYRHCKGQYKNDGVTFRIRQWYETIFENEIHEI